MKKGIYRRVSYARGPNHNGRPTFTIMTTSRVTTVFPKWFVALVANKKIKFNHIEPQFRALKEKLAIIGFDLANYSLYEEIAFIEVIHTFDGHPKDAQDQLKADLRLYNVAMREFFAAFKPAVSSMLGWFVRNGRVYYTPIAPRNGAKKS